MEQNDGKLKHTLELARTEINRQNPHLALEYLKTVQRDVEDMAGSSAWAEHQLLSAEALSAYGDPAAETEFQEALQRISNLPVRDLGLEMRANEHFGNYLASFARRRSLARQHYESAKRVAVESSLPEDSARLQLFISKIDLEADQDPRLRSFQNLMKAAAELHSTAQEQLAAWTVYWSYDEQKKQGLVAARGAGIASVEYFLGLLTSVKSGG